MMPRATYCQPQVASFGLTEAQAKERGYDVKVGRFPFQANGKALGLGDYAGLVKLIIDAKYGEILGAHLIGPEVTELLPELTLAQMMELTAGRDRPQRARPPDAERGADGSRPRRRGASDPDVGDRPAPGAGVGAAEACNCTTEDYTETRNERDRTWFGGGQFTETRLSNVDGVAGELTIAGFPLAQLAPNATFEEVLFLLWNDRLPTASELEALKEDMLYQRHLPPAARTVLEEAARRKMPVMDAMRMAVDTIGMCEGEPHPSGAVDVGCGVALVAHMPTIVATYWRILHGEKPVAPKNTYGHAANYLYMLTGQEPHAEASARSKPISTRSSTTG